MNELGLFTLALGLTKPWQVADIKFSKEEGRLDLRIDFVKGAKSPCPSCQETKEGEVHDTLDRTWRHLNFFQYETYLHARVPRIRCGTCGVKQVDVPWARPGSGFTLLFELLVLSLCWATHSRLQPVIQAARTIKRYWKGVVIFFNVRVTNGMVEGLNSKIKTAMKRAYGFKHVAYLRTIIYLVAG